MAFDCPVSLVPFHLECFRFNLFHMTFSVLKSTGQFSSRMVLVRFYVMLLCGLNPEDAFLAPIPQE